MSLWIDIKYVNLVSVRLRNFKRKNRELFNFACPYCGDSVKHKNKARGYLYTAKGTLLFRCHKCSVGNTFSNFLKNVDPMLYKEYTLEKYQSTAVPHPTHSPKLEFPSAIPKFNVDIKKSPLDELYKISELDENHPAVQYVAKRLIPKERWGLLFFAPKYIDWCSKHSDKEISFKENSPRLVIPSFNINGELIGWSGRAFGNEYLRYHNIKLTEEQLLFGLERVNFNKPIKVVEGQIDSLFLDNAIAVGGISAFDNDFTREHKDKVIFVVDNEPRAVPIVRSVEKYSRLGYSICLFPNTIIEKDINEMILSGRTLGELEQIIEGNTVTGIAATLKLSLWRKC